MHPSPTAAAPLISQADYDKIDHGLYAVRVGDKHLYGSRHSTEEETYNITIRNVQGGGDYVLVLAGAIKNLITENIIAIGETPILRDRRNEA